MDLISDKDKIIKIAENNGYSFLEFQENISLISFAKKDIRINIYLTKGTVGTCLNHPKKGKTQLFRKNNNLEDIKNLFLNPRIHTKKGYYTNN